MTKTSRKILFAIPTTGFGGAELHSLTLAKHIKQTGDEPILAFPHKIGTSRLYQLCLENNIRTINAPLAQLQMATSAENIQEQSARLQRLIMSESYDAIIVAAPSPMAATGLLKTVAQSGLPGICIFHLVAENLQIPQEARLTMLQALRNNFRFVGVSEFTKDMLCNALAISPSDRFIDFIPNGSSVKIPDHGFDLHQNFVNDTIIPIVTVGRIHPQKGGQYLVTAIPKVLQKFPEARFLWFGDGPEKKRLQTIARVRTHSQ